MKRIVEIDLIRTIAITMMVIYHATYDVRMFHGFDINLFGTGWEAFRITTVSLFLLVAGMASHFSSKPAKRAGTVLLAAAAVSIATYLYNAETFIYFGILHCIGLGLLVLIPLRRLKEWNLLLGMIVLASHFPLATFHFPLPPTLDYYPPIPWFGVMLIGSGIGHFLYVRHNVRLIHKELPLLTVPGRHALLIYLVHQPIILAVLWLIL